MRILLHIVSEHTSEENNFIQRAGIFLLNSLACQVDGQQKMLVGSLGAMEKMLLIIQDKLQQGVSSKHIIWLLDIQYFCRCVTT